MTIIQSIYLFLKQQGFNVYFPSQKQGECTEPYIVVKDASSSKFLDYSSTVHYYDIMCYVPYNQFSTLEPFVESVANVMKGMLNVKTTNERTSSKFDDNVKAYMISETYRNYQKIT